MSGRNGRRPPDRVDHLLSAAEGLHVLLSQAQPQETRGARGTQPAMPIYVAAIDHDRDLERFLRWWCARARSILGLALPPVPLARRAYIPCPYCLANSLWIDRQQWAVTCRNPACRDPQGAPYSWRVRWVDGVPTTLEIAHLDALIAQVVDELLQEAALIPDPEREEAS